MNPSRWHAITRIFHGANACEPAARDAFVTDACRGDRALQVEVERLLAADRAAGSSSPGPTTSAALQLPHGRALGSYRIEAFIGAGGMAQVYRGRDTRLDRVVAIKILPSHLRESFEFQQRFEREARAISQLTHPNICTLHDIGRDDGIDFLVMEHVEGETIAARLSRGPVAVEDALEIGIQTAAALEHAHRRNIVHRDLKPSNVMLTDMGVKLLDFGLAKLSVAAPAASAATTLPGPDTASGMLLGTLPYMSPEQVEGKTADARSDIWAVGCLLYELISGRPAFASNTSVIAAIVTREPEPLATIAPSAPTLLDHVVSRCLAKDPDDRYRDAGEIARELQWILNERRRRDVATTPTRTHDATAANRPILASALLGLLGVAAGAALWSQIASGVFSDAPAPPRDFPVHFSIAVGPMGLSLVPRGLAISPDGHTLAFFAGSAGDRRLYVRRIDGSDMRPVTGTDRGLEPFFSPDGKFVAFTNLLTDLRSAPVDGGTTQRICDCPAVTSGTWVGNEIFFTRTMSKVPAGLWSVPAAGGIPQLRLRPSGPGEMTFMSPQLLANERVLIFTVRGQGQARISGSRIDELSRVRSIVEPGAHGMYLPTGHLVFATSGELRAVPFDPSTLTTTGMPSVVVEDVAEDGFAVSPTGTLAYAPQAAFLKHLAWVDRSGRVTPLTSGARRFAGAPSLSPDGKSLAITVEDGTARNLWLGSADGGPLTKLTSGNDDSGGVSGQNRVFFSSARDGRYNIFQARADGFDAPRLLVDSPHSQRATSVSPDGTHILLNDINPLTGLDVVEMELGHPESLRPFANTAARELQGVYSPDGRWIAYTSDATGKYEVYLRARDGNGLRRQISDGGGRAPVWNPRGGEVLYQGPNAIVSARIVNGVPVGPPTNVIAHASTGAMDWDWTISADGSRFLVVQPAEPNAQQIHVVVNWLRELRSRVPITK